MLNYKNVFGNYFIHFSNLAQRFANEGLLSVHSNSSQRFPNERQQSIHSNLSIIDDEIEEDGTYFENAYLSKFKFIQFSS